MVAAAHIAICSARGDTKWLTCPAAVSFAPRVSVQAARTALDTAIPSANARRLTETHGARLAKLQGDLPALLFEGVLDEDFLMTNQARCAAHYALHFSSNAACSVVPLVDCLLVLNLVCGETSCVVMMMILLLYRSSLW